MDFARHEPMGSLAASGAAVGDERAERRRSALAASALVLAPAAVAKTYTDVPKGYWARADIDWVTNHGPAGAQALDDFSGHHFKPAQAVTREQLARALVVLGGLQNEQATRSRCPTCQPSEPYYQLRADRRASRAAGALQGRLSPGGGRGGVAGRRRRSCACCARSTPAPTGRC